MQAISIEPNLYLTVYFKIFILNGWDISQRNKSKRSMKKENQ